MISEPVPSLTKSLEKSKFDEFAKRMVKHVIVSYNILDGNGR